MTDLTWEEFQKVDLRLGTIIEVKEFPQAKKPAYQLKVDFGQVIGVKKTSAQITDLYQIDQLIGKQVVAVVNFPPKQIGSFMSECLITGFHRADGAVVLTSVEQIVPNGTRLA